MNNRNNTSKMKEVAKFAAGVTVWECIIHISFALNGKFPMKLLGVTITEDMNTAQIIIAATFGLFFTYYGWLRK